MAQRARGHSGGTGELVALQADGTGAGTAGSGAGVGTGDRQRAAGSGRRATSSGQRVPIVDETLGGVKKESLAQAYRQRRACMHQQPESKAWITAVVYCANHWQHTQTALVALARQLQLSPWLLAWNHVVSTRSRSLPLPGAMAEVAWEVVWRGEWRSGQGGACFNTTSRISSPDGHGKWKMENGGWEMASGTCKMHAFESVQDAHSHIHGGMHAGAFEHG